MALTRKFLSAMGIDEEKVDQIISAHVETVDKLKEQRDEYREQADKIPDLKRELEDANKSLKEHEKDDYKGKYEALKTKYDALHDEFNDYKSEVEEKETKGAKETAYRNLLKQAGVSDKRIDAVLRVSNLEGIELDADGNVKDADGVMDNIKEEWADFIVTKGAKGASTPTPPANNGGNSFESMSLAEKMVFANENPNNDLVKAWLEKK